MLTLIKFLRSLFKALVSTTAPWQMAVGAFFGILLGFLPIWPLALGPSLLGLGVLLIAILINCHFASVMLFMGLGKVMGLALMSPALAIGGQMTNFASRAADNPLLYNSHLSHTGYLGLTVIGLIAAPIIGIAMYVFTRWFRAKVQPKLLARRKLMLAGKVADNPIGFKLLCWFMGV
jgi:uncharacterized protein (TIGR03546 family)